MPAATASARARGGRNSRSGMTAAEAGGLRVRVRELRMRWLQVRWLRRRRPRPRLEPRLAALAVFGPGLAAEHHHHAHVRPDGAHLLHDVERLPPHRVRDVRLGSGFKGRD